MKRLFTTWLAVFAAMFLFSLAPARAQFDQFGGSTRLQCTNSNTQNFTVTGATWASGVATLTIGANTIILPTQVVISGTSPSGFNGTFNLSAETGTTVSYPLGVNPGAYSSGGTVTIHYFQPEKVGNRWWFCDPMGNVFWMTGIANTGAPNSVPSDMGFNPDTYAKSKYGDDTYHFSEKENRKFQSWGFNVVSNDSSDVMKATATCNINNPACYWPNGLQPVPMPYINESLISVYAAADLWNYANQPVKDMQAGWDWNYIAYHASLADYFDARFKSWLDTYLSPGGQNVAVNQQWQIAEFLDDSDYFWGSGAGPDFASVPPGHTNANIGYLTAVTSPIQTYTPNAANRGTAWTFANDTVVHAKADAKNPATACAIANPCSLRDYLHQKYGTITALDSAWGADYTTFDSDGTQVTSEVIGTGNGTATSFSHTLAHTPVSPESVLISVGGTANGGDCPWFYGACVPLPALNGTLGSAASASVQIAVGDQPWLSQVTNQSCGGCGLVSQQINFKTTYHMKAGFYTIPSREVGVTTNAGNVAVVSAPSTSDPNATGYDVYAAACNAPCQWSSIIGNETLQASNVAFGTNWVEPNTGITTGGSAPPNPPSTVNYSNGALTVIFTSAPANGASITVSYVYNGWMWGSGLMDEDGRGGAPDFAPTLSQTSGGSLSSATAYVKTTFVTANGESTASPESNFLVAASNLLTVASPQGGGAATGYNVYVATSSGAEKKQNSSPIALGANWTEPTTGIATTGTSPPANWLGTNPWCLETNAVRNPGGDPYFACDGVNDPVPNANATFGADLDAWIPEFVSNYFAIASSEWKKYAPNVPYFGLDWVGSWNVAAPKEVLQGVAPYIDGLYTQFAPNASNGQAMYTYMSQYVGDKPILNGIAMCAIDESAVWRSAPNSECLDPTQALRGQRYYNLINDSLNFLSYNNDYQLVGTSWWGQFDFDSPSEINNWGPQSLLDDAYDGVCSGKNQLLDQWGYTCGGEEFNYGNVMTSIMQANQLWWHVVQGPTKTVSGGVTTSGGAQ